MRRRSPRLTLFEVPNEEFAAAKALYEAALDRRRPAPQPFCPPPRPNSHPVNNPYGPALT